MSTGKIGLILSGGGVRGAYQVGVLSAINDILPAAPKASNGAEAPSGADASSGPKASHSYDPNPFNVIAGVSVGAINAAYLASRADHMPRALTSLKALWQSLSCADVYRTEVPTLLANLAGWLGAGALGRFGFKAPASLLDNTPLAKLLAREIDFDKMEALLDRGVLHALAITASSYAQSRSVAFYDGCVPTKPWSRARRTGARTRICVPHILGSSALPFIFPSIQIDGAYYGDGALRQIAPLSPAIHLGAEKLFVIGNRNQISESNDPNSDLLYPTLGTLSGQMLDIIFNDNLEADVERALRVNRLLMQCNTAQSDGISDKPAGEIENMRPLDIFMIQPSEDIRDIAARHLHEIPGGMKMLLKILGGWKAPWVLPSYLMFESGYINDLIALGYRDSIARKEEILAFLN